MALLGTALVQAHILGYYPTWSTWLAPIVVAGAAVGASVLLYTLVGERFRRPLTHSSLIARAATGLAIGALLLAPAVWSGYSTLYASSAGIPSAGPQVANADGGFGGPAAGPTAMTQAFQADGGGMPGGAGPGG